MKLAVFGSTGGLGQRIVKAAIGAGHSVTGIARNSEKASALFGADITVKIVPSIEKDQYSLIVDAMRNADCVIEVVDNDNRVGKVELLVKAAEEANIFNFIVCGGAGALFMNDEKQQRLYEFLGDSIGTWLKPVSLMHLEAQKIAFESKIPVVAQIAPPGMAAGELTNKLTPGNDITDGVNSASYEDVADVIMQSMSCLDTFNRRMIAMTNKK